MAGLLLNGTTPVLQASWVLPRVGSWTIDASVAGSADVSGAVTLSDPDGSIAWKGTVVRVEHFAETTKLRVQAGAGGLNKAAKARHYTRSLGAILQDLLAQSGDTLDPASIIPIITLNSWTVGAQALGSAVKALVELEGGMAWRFTPAGTFWAARETWAASALKATDYDVLAREGEAGTVAYRLALPNLLPGTVLAGDKLGHVEIRMDGEGFSATAILDGHEPARVLRDVVKGALPEIDYLSQYAATVRSQTPDARRVDVTPDDSYIPPLVGVPLWGEGGIRVSVSRGARVLVGWSAGDPSKPYAVAFDGGETVNKAWWSAGRIALGSSGAVNAVAKSNELIGLMNRLCDIVIAMKVTAVSPGSPTSLSGPPDLGTIGQVGAIKAQLQTIASRKVFVDS
jgi:hypothetical protein